jgi:hypothetical protein
MRRLLLALALLIPFTAHADPLFGKDMAGDIELPPPWGVGFDFFTMDQDYGIEDLSFRLDGVILPDPSQVSVKNEIQHFDFKADVWLFPFLNVFALVGHVQNDTVVDLSGAEIIGGGQLPLVIPFDSDGTVLGVGGTLVYGTPNWFTSLTGAYTDVDLSGDFDSSTRSISLQPRVGLIRGGWVFWTGAMYLDIEEKHQGIVDIPGIGSLPFSVTLANQDEWNAAVGTRYFFSPRASLSLELGFGSRDHTLFNYNFRF